MKTAEPRRLDFTHNEWDRQVRVYAAMGRSTKFIVSKTGLTKSQVNYRVPRAGVSRQKARDGETPISRMIEKETYGWIEEYFMAKPGG